MSSEAGPRFDGLPSFPPDAEPPLPPPRPWYRRLPGLIWRLFPATLICAGLFGFFGFLFLGTVDMILGVLGGLAAGALVGLYIDFKHSLFGASTDD
jgi:hypothetical protein